VEKSKTLDEQKNMLSKIDNHVKSNIESKKKKKVEI